MKYEYRKAVTADIVDHIRDNIEDYKYMFANRYDAEERLYEILWIEDGVTGNASGSYTFNACKAKEYVLSDPDTVAEALRAFCVEAEEVADRFLSLDWKYFDVTARCYVLNECVSEALDTLEADFELVYADELTANDEEEDEE